MGVALNHPLLKNTPFLSLFNKPTIFGIPRFRKPPSAGQHGEVIFLVVPHAEVSSDGQWTSRKLGTAYYISEQIIRINMKLV